MQPSRAVIILNYKRPQNIGRIARAAKAAMPDAAILLIDQAADDSLRSRYDIHWHDVWYQRPRSNKGAGVRVPLAAALPFDHYFAIDDDTFLTGDQIGALAERLREDPGRAHGVYGQRVEWRGDEIDFRSGLHQISAPVSGLNQVYAFTRSRAQEAVALSALAGFPTWEDVGNADDLMLTCSASRPPLLHDLGPIELCATANEAGIALWRSDDFKARRLKVARKLVDLREIAVFAGVD